LRQRCFRPESGLAAEKKKVYMTVFDNEMTEFRQAVEEALSFVEQQPK
jgi:hypothetical protein